MDDAFVPTTKAAIFMDIELVRTLQTNPTFLPTEQIWRAFFHIIVVLVALFALDGAFLFAARSIRWRHGSKKSDDEDSAAEHKLAYRAVSILMNGLLGSIGLYDFFFVLPESRSVTERIEGFEELALLAYLQIAYQLWAIPMSLFFVSEPKEMIYHHLGVMVVGSLSAFFTNGFRYHNPFFFGLIESSSVPLVIMNIFKDSHELANRFPVLNAFVSLSFCLIFVVTRVIMWIPQASDFMKLAAMMAYTCDGYIGKVGPICSILVCLFLTALQLYWAGRIVRGLLAFMKGGNQKRRMKSS